MFYQSKSIIMQTTENQILSGFFASALQAEGPWFESMYLHLRKTRQSFDWWVFSFNSFFSYKRIKAHIKENLFYLCFTTYLI